jgi:hypothetical protein
MLRKVDGKVENRIGGGKEEGEMRDSREGRKNRSGYKVIRKREKKRGKRREK